MRILGFSKRWPKLEQNEFTTFRVERKDEDWKLHETVQIVYKPRSPKREILGTAKIIRKEPRFFFYMPNGLFKERIITDEEAKKDGFPSAHLMFLEFAKMHGKKAKEQLNKLMLRWLKGGLDKGQKAC